MHAHTHTHTHSHSLSIHTQLAAREQVAAAPTMQLAQQSFVNSPNVPAVSDCGLFGTTCDGNTYLQVCLCLKFGCLV